MTDRVPSGSPLFGFGLTLPQRSSLVTPSPEITAPPHHRSIAARDFEKELFRTAAASAAANELLHSLSPIFTPGKSALSLLAMTAKTGALLEIALISSPLSAVATMRKLHAKEKRMLTLTELVSITTKEKILGNGPNCR